MKMKKAIILSVIVVSLSGCAVTRQAVQTVKTAVDKGLDVVGKAVDTAESVATNATSTVSTVAK